MDIGLYASRAALEHKTEQAEDGKGNEATWNMGRVPKNLGKEKGPDRLFFACDGYWRGYFLLVPEVLYNPEDEEKPYSLLFDATTWKDIEPISVKRFRGFRYLKEDADVNAVLTVGSGGRSETDRGGTPDRRLWYIITGHVVHSVTGIDTLQG